MIPIKEAKSIVEKHLFEVEKEQVLLKNAGDRILAQDVVASFPSPRFDNSAMDGFAVRSVDTIGASNDSPVTLNMVGVSSAGT
ncbi:MAG: hypothetical protein HVK24_00215, partial [Pelagibacteraceae bacterium]|nr:hypothetical protein [Pelagibacteraceae bacterium]